MKHYLQLATLVIIVLAVGCVQQKKEDFLYKFFKGDFDEVGVECGYVNSSGDTVIAPGKYYYCYTDTLKNFAIVLKKDGECVAIDKNNRELFRVYWFDNGPDYFADGLLRIIKNGKIGYANRMGEVVIKPQFDCAFPFQNGRAKVSFRCNSVLNGEHRKWKSLHWFYIDKTGKRVDKLSVKN